MSTPAGVARPLSEIALVAVHVTVVLGFDRLFLDDSFRGTLLGFTLAAHGLAVLARWRGLRPLLAAAVAVVGLVLAVAWLLFPDTTAVGLPTGSTWTAAVDAVRAARTDFPAVIAPTAVTPGFELVAGVALWAAAWFADWAAFRLRATVEAVAPAAVIFVFVSLLGSGQHRVAAATTFGLAVAVFVAAHRALRAQLDQAWISAAPAAGPRAVLRAGGTLGVLVLLAAVVVGPRLPGAESEPVVEWRGGHGGNGPRVTVSPMVELKRRLVQQGNLELFQVRADAPSYWRLTAVGRFDGSIFSSVGDYSPADDDLPSDAPVLDTSRRIRQEIRITALSTIWAPTAYEAQSVEESSEDLRWDTDSSTLIIDGDEEDSDGLEYVVVSESPDLDAEVLSRSGTDDDGVSEVYTELPDDFPEEAREFAAETVEGAGNRYEQARMLQDRFRSSEFTYDLTVEEGHGDDALLEFLEDKRGYCEQFAGAFAALARTLGIPSRVAVGFTPGEADVNDPTLYRVRGLNAHAWPELWFPDVGWVPFEPTPSRGLPGAEDYTGAAAQQAGTDGEPEEPSSTTTDPSATTTSGPPSTATTGVPTTTDPSQRTETTPAPPGSGSSSDGGPSAPLVAGLAVVVVLLAALAAVLAAPALRRRRGAVGDGAGAIAQAWTQTLVPVRWATGLRPHPAETHAEFASRAAAPLGSLGAPFGRLADLATEASWSDAPLPAEVAREATGLAQDIEGQVTAEEPTTRRLRRRLSWREAFGLVDRAP